MNLLEISYNYGPNSSKPNSSKTGLFYNIGPSRPLSILNTKIWK